MAFLVDTYLKNGRTQNIYAADIISGYHCQTNKTYIVLPEIDTTSIPDRNIVDGRFHLDNAITSIISTGSSGRAFLAGRIGGYLQAYIEGHYYLTPEFTLYPRGATGDVQGQYYDKLDEEMQYLFRFLRDVSVIFSTPVGFDTDLNDYLLSWLIGALKVDSGLILTFHEYKVVDQMSFSLLAPVLARLPGYNGDTIMREIFKLHKEPLNQVTDQLLYHLAIAYGAHWLNYESKAPVNGRYMCVAPSGRPPSDPLGIVTKRRGNSFSGLNAAPILYTLGILCTAHDIGFDAIADMFSIKGDTERQVVRFQTHESPPDNDEDDAGVN